MKAYLPFLLIGFVLAGCQGEPPPPEPHRKFDPAVIAALNDPIMIDPDLVSQNRGDTVITTGGFDAVPLEPERPGSVLANASD